MGRVAGRNMYTKRLPLRRSIQLLEQLFLKVIDYPSFGEKKCLLLKGPTVRDCCQYTRRLYEDFYKTEV